MSAGPFLTNYRVMCKRFIALFLSSALLGSCPAVLKAQQPAHGPQTGLNEQKPVLRTFTRLVQVNVIVRDRKGDPVKDLMKEDFTVYDENHPQEIAVFSSESSSTLSSPPKPLPPNVFTNVSEAIGQVPGSVTVILF